MLARPLRKAPAARLALLLALAPAGCLAPTEAVVEISTDAACKDVAGTGITAGLLHGIETADYGTTSQACEGSGDLGSIVLLPPDGDEEAAFAFKVVTSLGVPVESCVAPDYGPSCIVARRSMRFVKHGPFHVPVRMDLACAGVRCPEEQTCVAGVCRSAKVDPSECTKPDGCAPEPGVPPPYDLAFGGAGTQLARHLAVGADGVVVSTGSFDGELGLGDSPLQSQGGQDIYLASWAPGGALRWARSFGGAGLDEGSSVAIDTTGEAYLLARFSESVDFGGGALASNGGADLALVKHTSYGAPVWAVSFGGPGDDSGGKVAVAADHDVLVAGQFSGTMKLGSAELASAGGGDLFVARFTPAGDVRWAKSLGGAGSDGANAVAVDAAGNAYVTGQFSGELDYGGAAKLTAVGGSDVLLASFDPQGGLRWAKGFGSKGNDVALDISARGDRIVVTGGLSAVATIDGAPLAATSADGFVIALDPDGKVAWAQVFGDKGGTDQGTSVDLAADGSIAIGGVIYSGTVFGSPATPLGGTTNPFIAVLEPSGSPRWARAYSSSQYANATSVAAAADGYAYLAGWFTQDLVIEGKTLSSKGAEDAFLLRLAPP